MKGFLVLAVGLLFIGFLFKVMHWPYANFILLLGYCGLFVTYPCCAFLSNNRNTFTILKVGGLMLFSGFNSLTLVYPHHIGVFKLFSSFGILIFLFIALYLYMGFEAYKATKGERFVGITFLIGLCILAAGLYFKVLHWPGGNVLIYAGLFIAITSFVGTLFIGDENNE